jgi:hypothetical protein
MQILKTYQDIDTETVRHVQQYGQLPNESARQRVYAGIEVRMNRL